MKVLKRGKSLAARLTLRATAAGLFAVLAAGAALTAGSAAHAATTHGAAAATCDPKLDYEYLDVLGNGTWTNVCGDVTFQLQVDDQLFAVRMPTTPYHRIWLHQNSNGSGLSLCLYSTGQDLYMYNYDQDGQWVFYPGNIQVSANTAPC